MAHEIVKRQRGEVVSYAGAQGGGKISTVRRHGAPSPPTLGVLLDPPETLSQFVGHEIETRAGRYNITSLLGNHANSVSFIATKDRDEQKFVVRILKRKPRQKFVTYMENQAHKLPESAGGYVFVGDAQLRADSSDHGVNVYGLVRPYEPKTLRATITGSGATSRKHDVVDFVRQATEALEGLHNKGIVHRDLRPDNILLSDDMQFVLVDYGLPPNPQALKEPQVARYAAPEVFSSRLPGKASDIYSLGRVIEFILHSRSETFTVDDQGKEILNWLVKASANPDPKARPTLSEIRTVFSAAEYGFPDLGARLEKLRSRAAGYILSCAQLASADDESSALAAVRAVEHLLLVNQTVSSSLMIRSLSDVKLAELMACICLVTEQPGFERDNFGRTSGAPVVTVETTEIGISDKYGDIDDQWRAKVRVQMPPPPDAHEIRLLRETPLPDADVEMLLDEPDSRVDDQLQLARELRSEILSSDAFLYSEDVAALLSRACPAITPDHVRIMRSLGMLLAVSDHDRLLYPLFQFDLAKGVPFSEILATSRLLSALDHSWSAVDWWMSPCRPLKMRIPRELLRDRENVQADLVAALEDEGREAAA